MSVHARFQCPSASLGLRSLLTRTQGTLWIGLGLAVAVHAALTQLSGWREEQRAAKPLTTQFIKRRPRLTKPLELKKRLQPRRRNIRRTMISVEARADRRQGIGTFQPSQVLRRLARPRVAVNRATSFQAAVLEPQAMAQMFEGKKQAKDIVDMALEMLDIQSLDTGKHHAVVIQDPTDKREIKGFFHLLLARPRALSVFGGRGSGSSVWDDMKITIAMIADAMNQYTHVRTDVVGQVTFDHQELFKVPWVMTPIPNPRIRITPSEAQNMGKYLMSGGFQFLENAWGRPGRQHGLEEVTREIARETLASVGSREGKDWEFECLPESHAIYHCYFDFDRPPPGKDMQSVRNNPGRTMCDYLEGITIDGRLWILFGQKGYAISIHDFRLGGPYEGFGDIKRPLQFCVNIIIFALTQEGSITNQVMDSVGY